MWQGANPQYRLPSIGFSLILAILFYRSSSSNLIGWYLKCVEKPKKDESNSSSFLGFYFCCGKA
jgi:hypothetical protein